MSVSSSTSTRRCGICRRQKQKCTWTRQDDACDHCLEKGFSCPPQKGTPGFRLPTRSLVKCDYCRKAHETCHPVDRKWPGKCDFCIPRGYPCSVPRTKKQFEDLHRRQDDEETETSVEDRPQKPNNKPAPSISNHVSEVSDSDDSGSHISAPDMPPVKRIKEHNGGIQPTAKEDEGLKHTIQTIEAEFQEILKAEQEKYETDIKALKVKHRMELDQQRQKYESRIDDLIRIMKNL